MFLNPNSNPNTKNVDYSSLSIEDLHHKLTTVNEYIEAQKRSNVGGRGPLSAQQRVNRLKYYQREKDVLETEIRNHPDADTASKKVKFK